MLYVIYVPRKYLFDSFIYKNILEQHICVKTINVYILKIFYFKILSNFLRHDATAILFIFKYRLCCQVNIPVIEQS